MRRFVVTTLHGRTDTTQIAASVLLAGVPSSIKIHETGRGDYLAVKDLSYGPAYSGPYETIDEAKSAIHNRTARYTKRCTVSQLAGTTDEVQAAV